MADEAFCEHGWRKMYPEPCPACSAAPSVPEAGATLTEDERADLIAYFLRGSDGSVLVSKVERILAARAGLSPEAVREREAAAWDKAHQASCDMAGNCWGGGCPLHDNPYRSADR